MKKLTAKLMAIHNITYFKAHCTVLLMYAKIDEGYNPIDILKENGLDESDQWDLQLYYLD